MNKWFTLIALAGGLIGCGDADIADESPEALLQVAGGTVDGGSATATPATSADGSTAIATGAVGSSCNAPSDCTFPKATCTKTVSIAFAGVNINYPGGYCTKSCRADTDCAAGSSCPMAAAALLLPELSSCLKLCTVPSDCREGYTCQVVPSLPGFGSPAAAGAPKKHCLPPLPTP